MHHLYNSRGIHIATEVDGYLFARTGRAVGRYLPRIGIFVDLEGRYLGKTVCLNRLVRDTASKYRQHSFGPSTYQGSLGTYETPPRYSALSLPPGFEDINLTALLKAS